VTTAFRARPRFELLARGRRIELGARTIVMGILNCTPDSFSDGGAFVSPDGIQERLSKMAADGADWIDIGGESTRPGAAPVSAEEEWRRVAPAFRAVSELGLSHPISIDTTKPLVAARALEAGAAIINDVSALSFAPELADLAAETDAALILMHMKGEPRTMQNDPNYGDLLADVRTALAHSVTVAESHGVAPNQIILDPGIGFGKTAEGNLDLIAQLPALAELDLPILVGASRKSFLGKLFDLPVDQRGEASAAAHVGAILAGAQLIRVHDVKESVRTAQVADALLARLG